MTVCFPLAYYFFYLFLCVSKKYTNMKKKHYVTLIIFALLAASCTFAVYIQKDNTNSTQKVENPTSASADSASITIQTPVK